MRKKNGRWYAQWMEYHRDENGKLKGRQVTRAAGANKADAVQMEVKNKAYWENVRLGKTPDVSVEQVLFEYLSTQTQKPSFKAKKSNTKHLLRVFSGRRMNQIATEDIAQYVTRRRHVENAEASTINKEIQLLSAAIKYVNALHKWQLHNPCIGQRMKQPPGRVRWLTAAERERLIAACDGIARAPLLRQWVIIAMNTGMRYREIIELEWSKIDLENDLIILSVADNKTRQHRGIPLNKNARAAIMQIRDYQKEHAINSSRLFTDKNGKPLLTLGKRAFKTALKKAQLEDLTQRDLRHVAASAMIQAGASIQEVQEVLGHRDISTTQIYAHLAPNAARSAVQRLDDRENLGNCDGND